MKLRHSTVTTLGLTVATSLLVGIGATAAQAAPSVEPVSSTAAQTVDVLADLADLDDAARAAVAKHIAAPADTYEGASVSSGGAVLLPTGQNPTVSIIGPTDLAVTIPDAQVVDSAGAATVLDAGTDSYVVQPTEGGVQIVNVATQPVAEHSFSFDTQIPAGAHWAASANGGLALVDATGVTVGGIAQPWSVDADGVSLPTSFTVDGSLVTQHVDTSGAAFPVVSDPSFWTVAECIGSIALLVGFAWAKLASLIAKIKSIGLEACWNWYKNG